MRLAILSDIHANLHALEAVWADLEAQAPDAVYCLGDLVGYGAYPNEVIAFLRARRVPTLMGNYDQGVGFDLDDCGCIYKDPHEKRLGDESLRWSRAQTTPENKAYLRTLPYHLRIEGEPASLLLVHGSPRKVNEYLYEDRPQATFERLARGADYGALFFGHTHLPYAKRVGGVFFVNTGSVGKPRDGDLRGGYTLVQVEEELRIDHRRVQYDVGAAARAVRSSGLPDHFAGLLEGGGVVPAVPAP